MYQNKFLLPHFVQHIGAALLVLAAVCLCFCKCEMVLFLSLTAASIGLLLTVISRERTEDEYIGYLRMRSVFCVVLVYMVYAVASPVVSFFGGCLMAFETFVRISDILSVCGVPLLALLYFLLFKGAVMLGSKRKVAE